MSWYVRISLALAIVGLAVALIIYAQAATGFGRQGADYLIIGIGGIAEVVIPSVIAADLLISLTIACWRAARGELRPATLEFLRVAAADFGIAVSSLAAGLAVLHWM